MTHNVACPACNHVCSPASFRLNDHGHYLCPNCERFIDYLVKLDEDDIACEEQTMTDRACHLCGQRPASFWMWQGGETPLCYPCWDEVIGTGEPDDYPDYEELGCGD